MFERVFNEYKTKVKFRDTRFIKLFMVLPLPIKYILLTIIVLVVIGIIASYLGENEISVGVSICLLIIVFSMLRDSHKLPQNEESAIVYKDKRLRAFTTMLNNKEIGPMNSPDGMALLISCVDEHIKKEEIKLKNRSGVLVGGIVTTVFVPIALKLIEFYKLNEIGGLNIITLASLVLSAFIYSTICIGLLYPYYLDYKFRNYYDLCDMKSDLIYLQYLYKNNPSWDTAIVEDNNEDQV